MPAGDNGQNETPFTTREGDVHGPFHLISLRLWDTGRLLAYSRAVVLRTQTANHHSTRLAAKLGFTEVERFEGWGAEQWFGVWSPVMVPSG